MDVFPIQRRLEASDVPPERLAGNSQLSEQEKLGEATRQFEAVLLRQILEGAQKTVIRSRFTDESTVAGIYRDLATYQLAESISKSGTLGFSTMLERQLTRECDLAGPDRETEAQPTARAVADVARPALRMTEHVWNLEPPKGANDLRTLSDP